ncbi:unnamed protein product, partial [Amoebophrya sp. A25]
LVQQVAEQQRFWRKQREFESSLILNYVFMFINLILIPLFGVDSLRALLASAYEGTLAGTVHSFTKDLHKQTVRWRLFALKYLISTLMVSTALQSVQAPQILYQKIANFFAVTHADRLATQNPFVFDFGYWYAFTSILFALTLIFGVVERLAINSPFQPDYVAA